MKSKKLLKVLKFSRKCVDFGGFAILSFISALCLYPIVIPIFIVVTIYQQLIKYLVKITDPKCGSMLTGLNAVLTGQQPYTNPYATVAPYCTFSSKLDRKHIINTMNERLMKTNCYPELKQRIVRRFGYHFWYPVENFSVERHVSYLIEDHPDTPVTKNQLRKLGSEKLAKMQFNPDLSPWEVYLVPNLVDKKNPAVKSAIIFRMNHCLMDGYGFYNFVSKLADKPWRINVGKAYITEKTGVREFSKKILTLIKVLAVGPYHVIKTKYFSTESSEFLCRALNPIESIEKGFLTSMKESPMIDSSRLKHLRTKLKVNTSILLITIVGEVTMRFVRSKCAKGFSKIPDSIYIHLPFPLPSHPDKMTNYWSLARMRVRVNKKNNPMSTLKNIQKQFEILQNSVSPLALFAATQLVGLLPIFLHPPLDRLAVQSVLLSSMPAPEETVDIFGYKWDAARVGGTPPAGSAMAIACIGYMGQYILDVAGVKTLFKSQKDFDIFECHVYDVLKELEAGLN